MPADEEVHQCELLDYMDRYLEYVATPAHCSRWRLCMQKFSTIQEDDLVVLDYVLFCPGCGKDLRDDTGSERGGRPQLESILKRLLEKGLFP